MNRFKIGDYFLYYSNLHHNILDSLNIKYWFVGKITSITKQSEYEDDPCKYTYYHYRVCKSSNDPYSEKKGSLSQFAFGSGFHVHVCKVSSSKWEDLLTVIL